MQLTSTAPRPLLTPIGDPAGPGVTIVWELEGDRLVTVRAVAARPVWHYPTPARAVRFDDGALLDFDFSRVA